jgi:hypothetical protein
MAFNPEVHSIADHVAVLLSFLGWGKPPVDEYGRPLYGDVFGITSNVEIDLEPLVDKTFLWGSYEIADEQQPEEDDEEDSNQSEEIDGNTYHSSSKKSLDMSGLETPSTLDGASSVVSGLETPATIDLRKRSGDETPVLSDNQHRELYKVMKENKSSAQEQGSLFGSDRTYTFDGSQESGLGSDSAFKHMNNYSTSNGNESDEGRSKETKKRKAEQSVIPRKLKEFKF